MAILESQSHLFCMPDDLAYFNCSRRSPELKESAYRRLSGSRKNADPWNRGIGGTLAEELSIRRLAAGMFGGDEEGYRALGSAERGWTAVARAIEHRLTPGGSILMVYEENALAADALGPAAGRSGSSVATIPAPEDDDWTRAIIEGISEAVRVVVAPTCVATTGIRIDISRIGQACRDADCALVVDATPSLGAMPFHVEDAEPDFVIAEGNRWLLCPDGFTLLYVAAPWRTASGIEASVRGGYAGDAAPETISRAIAALGQIRDWGIENIAESLSAINDSIAAHLELLDIEVPGAPTRCPHTLGARLRGWHRDDLATGLSEEGVIIGQRGDRLSFCPHLHVRERDVRRLLDSLDRLLCEGSLA